MTSTKGARPRTWSAALSLFAFAFLAGGCDGRAPQQQTSRGHLALIHLAMGAPESPLGDGFFPQPASESFLGLMRSIQEAERSPKTRGVFVSLRGTTVPLSQAKEVGESLSRIRERKLPVICHTHEIDNATFWLLSRGCSEIWVSAAGAVSTVGIGAELGYIKGAFDKLGVVPQMLAIGKYKSGGEALTRTEPSEESLGNLQKTLSDLRNQWLEGVTQGHENTQARRHHVEDGPWTPKRAAELGLISRVGFEHEALSHAKEISKTEATESIFGAPSTDPSESPAAAIVRLLAGADKRQKNQTRIAVVPAVGSITMAAGGPLGGGGGITAAAMTRTIARLRKDDAVKAIVIRMDSPGGSPLASDLIWQEVMLARETKPVVVSIGGMSASGGYYIASAATRIVASSTAIVGSIGVFGGKIVLSPALAKVGITHYPVPASPEEGAAARAGHLSPLTFWDEPTQERVRQSMQGIYDLFVARVAEGRGLSAEHIASTAEGEIFLAPVGKSRGLIDEIGGILRALTLARELAHVPESTPVVLEGAGESLFESLLLGPEPGAQEVEAALFRFERARLQSASRWSFQQGLATLEPFAAVLAPLLAGENVVTALPFTLRIR